MAVKRDRKHQAELAARAREIVDGAIVDKFTFLCATPGGGKSRGAARFTGTLLNGGVGNRGVWVTPRSSLSKQAAEDFNREARPLSARRADNTPPLFRDIDSGRICYTTNYQAVDACPEVHRDAFERDRIVLVLDEFHHLSDEETCGWLRSITPLVDRAAHVLAMTGSPERNKKTERLPWVEYERSENGLSYPRFHVTYSRRDALAERAIVPIEFSWVNGWVHYQHGGNDFRVDISQASDEEVRRVIRHFLSRTDYRDELLVKGLNHWQAFRRGVYESRAIVICASQEMARDVDAFVRDTYKCQVARAICDDANAHRDIERFRSGEYGDVLVTVGMAYEGLDVPDCTHLICLTDKRSAPWLEQAFARVTRVDYKARGTRGSIPYENQRAHIFVPDDPLMRSIVERILAAQAEGLRDAEERDGNGQGKKNPNGPGIVSVALGSKSTTTRISTEPTGMYAEDQARLIDQARHRFPQLMNMDAADVLSVIMMGKESFLQDEEEEDAAHEIDEEPKLRKTIESMARARDKAMQLDPGSTNRLIFSRFRKSREAMGVGELRSVLSYLKELCGERQAS